MATEKQIEQTVKNGRNAQQMVQKAKTATNKSLPRETQTQMNGEQKYKSVRMRKELYDVLEAIAQQHHTKKQWLIYTMAVEYNKRQKGKGMIQMYGEEFAKLF